MTDSNELGGGQEEGDIAQLWKERRDNLNLNNTPEEVDQISLIYYMGIADILASIGEKLERSRSNYDPQEFTDWFNGLADECDNKLGDDVFPQSDFAHWVGKQ